MPTKEVINFSGLQESINALRVEVTALRMLYEENKKVTDHHDKILVRGYDEHLPLAEVVRNLTNSVSDYIAQKDKEEQYRREQDAQKKSQWDKLKWVIISFSVPIVLVFIGQAIIFFFRIYPILDRLSTDL